MKMRELEGYNMDDSLDSVNQSIHDMNVTIATQPAAVEQRARSLNVVLLFYMTVSLECTKSYINKKDSTLWNSSNYDIS